MTHATEFVALRAECERLKAENARLREALREQDGAIGGVEIMKSLFREQIDCMRARLSDCVDAMRRAEVFHDVQRTDECWDDAVSEAEAWIDNTKRRVPGC